MSSGVISRLCWTCCSARSSISPAISLSWRPLFSLSVWSMRLDMAFILALVVRLMSVGCVSLSRLVM